MTASSGVFQHRLDAISIRKDGSLFLAASSLTHRYWVGSLYFYREAHQAVDEMSCNVMIQVDTGMSDIAHIENSNNFITATDSGCVQLWEISGEDTEVCKMACLASPQEHDNYVTSVSINADQSKALSSSQDSRLKVWDLEEFVSVSAFKGHHDAVNMAVYHLAEPSIFVSCSMDGNLLLWDTRKPRPATLIENQALPSKPTCLAWQPEKQYSIAVGTESGHVLLQDVRKGMETPTIIQPHDRTVHRMSFAPHRSDWLATASEDSTASVIQFDDQKSASLIDQIKSHSDFVQDVAWHPAKHDLFSCSWDTRLRYSVIQSDFTTSSKKPTPPVEVIANDLQKKAELNGTKDDGEVKDISEPKIEQMEVLDNATVEA